MKLTKNISRLTAMEAAFCLVLSSCMIEENTPEHITATTPLTLTESLTEESLFVPEPMEEEPAPKIMLAVYNPFSDVQKPDDALYRELSEAVGDIEDATTFLYANPTGFYEKSKYFTNFADTKNPVEKNEELEYEFYPVNPEFASTEEELFDHIRGLITNNYMSDEEIREELFTPANYDNQPNYKTIDGVLCMKWCYMGVLTQVHNDEITILSHDENSAEIVAYGQSLDDPKHVYITLKKSNEGIWQLDGYEQKTYFENEATLLYNVLVLNSEKLNRILNGGNVPEYPLTIEVNGFDYMETDLNMSIDEMHEFFEDIFLPYKLKITFEPEEDHIAGILLEEYRQKYIDEVYYEQDGILFRRTDSPKWYLPEIEIDPYSRDLQTSGGAS